MLEQLSVENRSEFKEYILNTVLQYLISATVAKGGAGMFLKLWIQICTFLGKLLKDLNTKLHGVYI